MSKLVALPKCPELLGINILPLTQESNPPMVQIGDSHASMNAHPVGQVVKFSTLEKMKAPSFL